MNFLPLKTLTVPSQKVVHFHAIIQYTTIQKVLNLPPTLYRNQKHILYSII